TRAETRGGFAQRTERHSREVGRSWQALGGAQRGRKVEEDREQSILTHAAVVVANRTADANRACVSSVGGTKPGFPPNAACVWTARPLEDVLRGGASRNRVSRRTVENRVS